MTVIINGKETQLDENPGRNITLLLKELEVKESLYVTVELNGDILDRPEFDSRLVKNGDVIEFLYFMGGGR